MKKTLRYKAIIALFGCLIYSCSVEKFIPEDERLYTGAKLIIESDSTIKKKKSLRQELENAISPEPNSKILGMRLGLYVHYKAQREKPGFINKWLNKKIGEEPVYQSDVENLQVEDILVNRLENDGFFYSRAASNFNEKRKMASITYKVQVPTPYRMEKFRLDTLKQPIYSDVKNIELESPLKKETRFDYSNLKLERKRLDVELKKRGYYNFNPDFFIFEADTNQYDNKKFDLFLKLKAQVPKKSLVPYKLEQINIYPNHDLKDTTNTNVTRYDNKNFIQDPVKFKPKYLNKFITIDEGSFYSPTESKNTARRLSTIGAYKYVNIQYREIDSLLSDSLGALKANIYLSPLAKRSVRAELQAVTKSNNFTGPNLALTYSNRNLFKGGETLNISASLGYETQFASGQNAGLNSVELGLKSELIFPRVISPFDIRDDFFKYSVPKTKTSLGLNYLSRSKLYTLLSGSALFGYVWNANRFVTYELNPISVSYTSLINTTPDFEDILNENPFLRRSFDQQFISGLTFSFTYNEIDKSKSPYLFFLNTTLDVAGNSISLLGSENEETGSKELLGLEYAQYAKADVDFRFHYKFGKKRQQTLATRLFGGYGYAYGNSNVIPFVKQYFSGGPYSVRAFRIRSLGPGTYDETVDGTDNSDFFDQTGNIRLEANIEYRFPLISFLKGAVFADAGNVWNSEPNPIFNGQDVFSSNFINELGMGAGVGLRVDVQGFVIRFDLAAPFKDPSRDQGRRFDFRYDEPVLNFAIGYPF